jgi:hypothetical protein
MALTLLVFGGSAQAQWWPVPNDLTEDQTVEIVSQKLSDIQEEFPTIAQASTLEPAVVKRILVRALSMVMELRGELANSPYLRVSSFAVDFPSGVSVEFSVPPAEDRGE